MADPRWTPRDLRHRQHFAAHVLAPLIAATRPLDLRTAETVDAAARAWILSLAEIPAAVLEAGVERLLAAGPTWMPKPGDLRRACAELVDERRRTVAPAAQALIANCIQCQGSTWEDYRGEDGVARVRRCGCHARSLALLADLPTPIALPPAPDDPAVPS